MSAQLRKQSDNLNDVTTIVYRVFLLYDVIRKEDNLRQAYIRVEALSLPR
jgi:hypothetical protein